MNLLRNLQRQHSDLLEISEEIVRSVENGTSFAEPDFRKDLSFIEGKIKIHLTMEDRHLYPLLHGHEDGEVRAAAADYRSRMMGLFDAFHAFVVKLRGAEEQGDEAELRAELLAIFRKLASRILYEEETLIPLLKKLGIS